MTNTTPIDPATVQRCIELLKGTGRYDKQWKRLSDMDEPDIEETWTYTTHPMDLLAGLLPKPEPTEAEKLVDAWLGGNMDDSDTDYVKLAQFILDRVNAQLTFPSTEGVTATERSSFTVDQWQANTLPEGPFRLVDENGREIASGFTSSLKASPEDVKAVSDAIRNVMEPQPRYVFGPWVKWNGGDCPVPGDWMVETVCSDEVMGEHDADVCEASDWAWNHCDCCDITHYRVRFTVGQWYDWAGGDCPVGKDVMVTYELRKYGFDETGPWSAKRLDWAHPTQWGAATDIIKFKITNTGETA